MSKTSIIIGGVPRSGKTLVAQHMASNYELSRIPGDSFITTFEELYPDMGIQHQDTLETIVKNFDPFITNFLYHLHDADQVNFVFDSYHVLPKQIANNGFNDKFICLFMGYTNIDPIKKLKDIRTCKNAVDWTDDIDDETILKDIEAFIKISAEIKEDCITLDIPYFDMSSDFEGNQQKVIDFILNSL